ncbi:MAG: hypothetical protein AB7J13_14170, partial [Pyrinomonadaceae bacterium]
MRRITFLSYFGTLSLIAYIVAGWNASASSSARAYKAPPVGVAPMALLVPKLSRPDYAFQNGENAAEPTAFGCSTVVTSTADAGPGSLREAITCSNLIGGVQTISFNIPGVGPHTIAPTTVLPTITDPANIDGYTQPGSIPNTNPTGAINSVIQIELSG